MGFEESCEGAEEGFDGLWGAEGVVADYWGRWGGLQRLHVRDLEKRALAGSLGDVSRLA